MSQTLLSHVTTHTSHIVTTLTSDVLCTRHRLKIAARPPLRARGVVEPPRCAVCARPPAAPRTPQPRQKDGRCARRAPRCERTHTDTTHECTCGVRLPGCGRSVQYGLGAPPGYLLVIYIYYLINDHDIHPCPCPCPCSAHFRKSASGKIPKRHTLSVSDAPTSTSYQHYLGWPDPFPPLVPSA
jgi:hypothetical protein